MHKLFIFLAAVSLVLVGCKPKDSDSPAAAPAAPAAAAPASTSADTGDLKTKVVGDWTLQDQQGNTKVDGTINIRNDGTFTNAGTVSASTPGDDGTISMDISYNLEGKWTLSGETISTTPEKVETHVDKMDIVTKDPKNQAAADAQKPTVTKQAEEQTKASLDKPSSTKIVSATDDQLTMVSDKGVKIVYNKKK